MEGVIALRRGSRSASALLTIAVLSAPLTAFGQFHFGAATNYSVGGTQIRALAAADFDGNGTIDIAASNDLGLTAIFLNLGDGTFRPPVSYGLGASSLVAADLNGDGKPDLIGTPVPTANGFSVILNHGDGTFAQPAAYPTSSTFGIALAAGDFAKEGRGRVAVLSVSFFGGGPTIDIFRSDSSGALTLVQTFAATDGAESVLAADVNSDGYADLITGNGNTSGTRTFSIYINKKDGTFSAPIPYGASARKRFAAGTLNADSQLDLAWGGDGIHGFAVSLNRGDGTFAAPYSVNFPQDRTSSYGIAIADLNGDGKMDVAVASPGNDELSGIYLFPGNGDGSFGTPVPLLTIPGVEFPSQVLTVDLNGDGEPDIVYDGAPNNYFVTRLTPGRSNLPPSIIGSTQGGNSGNVTFQIFYQDLQPGTTVKLSAAGLPDLIPVSATVSSYSTKVLIVTFNLMGASPGVYNLVLTRPDNTSATLANAFTVVQGGAPDITVSLIGRSVMRSAQNQPYFITVANNGTIDSGLVKVWISMPSYIQWQTPSKQAGAAGQLNGMVYLRFEVPTVPAGSNNALPVMLRAPDNPIYAHQTFPVQVWEEKQ